MDQKLFVTEELIGAALALASSLKWDISDGGHASVRCDYDLAGDLFDAAQAYRMEHNIPVSEDERDASAIRGLASLMRR
jgi:hypothetical protein